MLWIIWLDFFYDLTRRHGRIRAKAPFARCNPRSSPKPCGVKSSGFSRFSPERDFLTSHYMSPFEHGHFSLKNVVFFEGFSRPKKIQKVSIPPRSNQRKLGVADPNRPCRFCRQKETLEKPQQRANDLKQFVISCDLNLISVYFSFEKHKSTQRPTNYYNLPRIMDNGG